VRRLSHLALALALAGGAGSAHADLYYLIVGGLGGEPVYTESFADSTASMAEAARRTIADDSHVTVLSGEGATREALEAAFARLDRQLVAADRLAVFLVGHGTYDGTDYKFNLTGPDINGTELLALLALLPARNQVIVNATSASGAVLEPWAADGRAIITATRSGRERNATRFAEHWAKALSSAEADVNKNGSLSAQEAYDYAARMTVESFEAEGALATEHSQINGDIAQGFEISRLSERVASTGAVAALEQRAEALEEQIAALRLRREELGDDYFPQLQALLVELAEVQEQIDAAAPTAPR
jgi:polyhydroxyalkanoate synthesis regulator phasin